jgi:hypothetical protein
VQTVKGPATGRASTDRLNVREEPFDVGFGVSPEAARLASQVVLAAGDRVLAGVYAGAKTGAQRLDRPT